MSALGSHEKAVAPPSKALVSSARAPVKGIK